VENEAMYETLLKFYQHGLITISDLDKAVDKLHWITREQAIRIVGSTVNDKLNQDSKPVEDPIPNQEN
jgi:hypothetical protein